MSQPTRNKRNKDSGLLASPDTNVVTPKEKKKGRDKPDKVFPGHRRAHSGQTESRDSDDSRHYNEKETAMLSTASKTDKISGLSESSDSPLKSQKSPARDEKKVKKQLAYDELGAKKTVPKHNIPHNSSDVDVKKLAKKSVDLTKIKEKPATVAMRPKYRDRTKRHSYQFEKINLFPEEIPEKKKRRLSLESGQKSPLSASAGPVLVVNTNNTNNSSNINNINNTINNNGNANNGAGDDTKSSKQVRGTGKKEKGSDRKKREKKPKKESNEDASKPRDKLPKLDLDKKKEKKEIEDKDSTKKDSEKRKKKK